MVVGGWLKFAGPRDYLSTPGHLSSFPPLISADAAMRDPFPFASPQWLQDLTTPLARWTNSTALPIHAHEIIFSIALYTFIGNTLSPWISNLLCPKIYRNLDKRTKVNWDVHIVSLFQSVFICGLALYAIFFDEARATMTWRERLWGYTGYDGFMAAMACGYFIWDLVVSTINVRIFGYGMLAHAIAATVVFSFGFVSRARATASIRC